MVTSSIHALGKGRAIILRHAYTREGGSPAQFLVYRYTYISKEWDGDILHGMGWPSPPFSIYI